jgi:hypothetical protein
MKIRKPMLRILAGVLTLACVATAADVPNLTARFKTIDVPNALQTSTYGINNSGPSSGTTSIRNKPFTVFCLRMGRATTSTIPRVHMGRNPST